MVVAMASRAADVARHFRERLRDSPVDAYSEWFRAQEDLRSRGDEDLSRVLADDLWEALPGIAFAREEDRARFFHNVAVFFGSPGPAASLARAREAFGVALEHFSEHSDDGWHARTAHNFATALSNLGRNPAELEESVALFERALEWRTLERPIARAASLHNLGLALVRFAQAEPGRAAELLERAVAELREAVAIREKEGLAEGHARSLLHLASALDRLSDSGGGPGAGAEARACFEEAQREFARLGLRIPDAPAAPGSGGSEPGIERP